MDREKLHLFFFVIPEKESVAKILNVICHPGLDPGSRLRKTLIFLLNPVSSTGRQIKEKQNIWIYTTVSKTGIQAA